MIDDVALPAGTGTEIQYRVDDTTLGASGVSWDATNSYLSGPSRAGEPTAAAAAFFYDSTANAWKFGQGASPAWVAIGAPGGSSGQLQWNSSSSFAGTAQAYWDSTYASLMFGGQTSQTWSDADIFLGALHEASDYRMRIQTVDAATASTPGLDFVRGSGTIASPTAAGSGDTVGEIAFYGLSSTNLTTMAPLAYIRTVAKATITPTVNDSAFEIWTCQTSDTGGPNLMFEIDEDGSFWFNDPGSQALVFFDAVNVTLRAPYRSGEPTPSIGDMFYDSGAGRFKFYQNVSGAEFVTYASSLVGLSDVTGALTTSGNILIANGWWCDEVVKQRQFVISDHGTYSVSRCRPTSSV